VVRWLESLPERTGLLVSDSWRGMRICDLASAAGIDLLAKFAIVTGHDCDVPSVPSLSGVHVSERQWSCRAVGVLLEMLEGNPPPQRPVLIQPTGVNERGSTARVMVDDEALRDALLFIQRHADRPMSVADVADAAALGRRALERRFRRQLGRTVLCEIHRAHIEQAKRLLIETDLAMPAVAVKSGLRDDRQLLRLFRRQEGTSPGAFRQTFRPTGELSFPNSNVRS
jgi:LacI family transcriptional regulator